MKTNRYSKKEAIKNLKVGGRLKIKGFKNSLKAQWPYNNKAMINYDFSIKKDCSAPLK